MSEVQLKAGEERFFPVHSLVSFSVRAAKFAHNFVAEHQDEGPYMVLKNEGFPPGHRKHQDAPQQITIAVKGQPIRLKGSLFVLY